MNTSSFCMFYIVRHGQTEWNEKGLVSGQQNPKLTKEGIAKSEFMRDKLKHTHFDLAYTSDLDRTIDTADVILKNRHIELKTDKRLRERNYGSYEGTDKKKLKKDFEEYYKNGHTTPDAKWHAKLIPEMETDDEMAKRFIECLQSIAGKHPGKHILIVTSSGCIKTFLMAIGFAEKGTLGVGSIKNLGYMKVLYENNEFFVENADVLNI